MEAQEIPMFLLLTGQNKIKIHTLFGIVFGYPQYPERQLYENKSFHCCIAVIQYYGV